jgi:chemotaxis regulatin CheY-phosphate phosphatase CheZ
MATQINDSSAMFPDGGNGANGQAQEKRAGRDLLMEFARVVQDVIPLLDQMKSSIHESTQHIPTASKQLNSVTQATETATVEILNVLDSMTQRVTATETFLSGLAGRTGKARTLENDLTRALEKAAAAHPAEINPVRSLWADYVAQATNSDELEKIRASLGEVQNASVSIAMALQVQDITSQQISGVIHLIESVRTQLARVMSNLNRRSSGQPVATDDAAGAGEDANAFNPDAQYVHDPDRQEMADNIINKWSDPAE